MPALASIEAIVTPTVTIKPMAATILAMRLRIVVISSDLSFDWGIASDDAEHANQLLCPYITSDQRVFSWGSAGGPKNMRLLARTEKVGEREL